MSAPDRASVDAVVEAIEPQVMAPQDTSSPEGEGTGAPVSQPVEVTPEPAPPASTIPWWSIQPGADEATGKPEEGDAGPPRPTRVRTIRRPQMIHFPDQADEDESRPATARPADTANDSGTPVAPPRPAHTPPVATPPHPECCCSCPAKSWCQIPCGRQCNGDHPEEKKKERKTRKRPRNKEITKEPTREVPDAVVNPEPELVTVDVPRIRPERNSQALIFFWRDLDVRWRFVIFNGTAAEIGREGGIVSWGTQQLKDAAEQTSIGTAVGIGIAACAACHLLIDRRVANWPGYIRWFFRIPLASLALSVLLYAPGAQPLF